MIVKKAIYQDYNSSRDLEKEEYFLLIMRKYVKEALKLSEETLEQQ